MAQFKDSIGYVLQNEGGFSDNPSDSGGATNYGITHVVYSAYLGHQATLEEMKSMPLGDAMAIYHKHYWMPLNLDLVNSQGMATAIFDMGVNLGIYLGAELAQGACNYFAPPQLDVDGEIGPKSLSQLNTVNPSLWLDKYVLLVKSHYESIIQAHPKDRIFRAGWTNRANRLLTLKS